MQSTWLRATSGRLGRTTGNGSGSHTDNDSELMDSSPPKREQTRGRSFLKLRGSSAPTRLVTSIPETSPEEAPIPTSPSASPPVAIEGTLEFRKGHVANDAKSWRRSFVVFDMRDGGSITCYAQTSSAKSMTRITDQFSHHEDLVPRLHLPSHLNWVAKDIQHNSMGFVIEVTSNDPAPPSPESATDKTTTTATATVQNEQDNSSRQSQDHEDRGRRKWKELSVQIMQGRSSELLSQVLQQDIDRAKSKGEAFRIHFRCSRGYNEKILWLRAFEQMERLSFDLHRQRGLMNIFGNPNLKISHSRSRSHMAHLWAKAGMALEASFFESGDDDSGHSIHDDPGMRLRERFKGSGAGQGAGDKEYLVYPLYAYPNRWMTHPELYAEMIKPSETFHDLRESYAPQKEIGFIKVEILQCLGLPALDFASETDAVAYMVCGSYAFTSDVIWNKLNPMWLPRTRRACIFPLFHAYARLFVGIFDDDGKGEKDDFAGRVVLDIARCRPRSVYDVTLPLRLSNHVYSRRPRGSVRLRFSIEYKSDRDAILSYIPRSLEPPSPARHDSDVTVICADEKAFRNVVTTVHGIHMPGKFTLNLWKATMREMNFARKVITNSLIDLFLNIVTWKNPAMSLLIFSAWMYGVYRNEFSLVPIYLLSFLLLMMIQSYAFYGSDGPIQNGFVPPSWEELFVSLVKGGNRIEPLTTKVRSSTTRPKKNPKVIVETRTHRQRGNWLFRLLGFHKTLPKDNFHPEDYDMEFPYSRGIRNPTTQKAWYPKFTVLESLVSKSKSKKTPTDDEGESLFGDIGVSSRSMTDKRRKTWDLFSPEHKDKGRHLSLSSWGVSTRSDIMSSSNSKITIIEESKAEEVMLPKRLQYPDQNVDAKGPTRKKKIGDELGELRTNLHKMMFHLFNDRTHRIRRVDATYFGSRTSHLDQDLERLLNIGPYSSAIPIVARVGMYLGPIIGASQSGLCLTRALYNVFTWRDPILSFWLTMFLTVAVAVLTVFPWRLFFFVTGVLIVGPQNYVLRIMSERGTTPKFLGDFMERRKEVRAARLAERQRVKDVPRNQPILSCHTSDNSAPIKLSIDDVDPREVHEVCVPYSQLMYHRTYDWPPEATYSKCEPTSVYDERVAPKPVLRGRSATTTSSSDLTSFLDRIDSVQSL